MSAYKTTVQKLLEATLQPVPVHEYERCMKGFRYPACANPGQR